MAEDLRWRYGLAVINQTHHTMSYPINEFVTDLEKTAKTTDEWIASSASAAESACREGGSELSSAIGKGGKAYKNVRHRVEREVRSANQAMHHHPYPAVLAGIAAGALIGYRAASLFKSRTA